MNRIKRIPFLVFFLAVCTTAYAQTTFSGGLNVAESTNVGFWGINPMLQVQHKLVPSLNRDFRLNGFWDVGLRQKNPTIPKKEYHRSLYADWGFNYQLINGQVSWFLGAGGSYQVGKEQYVTSATYYGDQLTGYRMEENHLSRFGIFVENTVHFSKTFSLNLTVYQFNFWGEYMSIGPSLKF